MAQLLHPITESITLLATLLLLFLLLLLIEGVSSHSRQLLSTVFLFLVLIIVAQQLFDAFVLMKEIAAIFSAFFLAFIPLVSTVLVIMQSLISLVAWSPAIIFVLQLLVYCCDKLLIPSLFMALIFDICTRLYPQVSFSKIAELIRKTIFSIIAASIVLLSSFLTFSSVAFFSIQETFATPLKKVIEQNVPIIGSLLVEGMSLLKKFQSTATTVTGFTTITALLILSFYPAATLLIKAFTFKLAGAIAEPFVNNRISNLLDDIGKTLFMLCAIALLLAIGFIVIWLILFFIVQIGTGKSL
ncbi:stage III sporulation protein AE [Lysinibacillus sp. KU-BSD001]|uniref:stage III sporulation protein AE n=1 Tax=Lysinibacillus sp. KU-BSD001 TaxID=3141328 RepID=UPI0036E66EE2